MKVKVYSSPSCTFCDSVKTYLKDKEVEFEEVDVTASQEALDELKEKTGCLSVPVITVYDEEKTDTINSVILGFDKDKLDEALNLCTS